MSSTSPDRPVSPVSRRVYRKKELLRVTPYYSSSSDLPSSFSPEWSPPPPPPHAQSPSPYAQARLPLLTGKIPPLGAPRPLPLNRLRTSISHSQPITMQRLSLPQASAQPLSPAARASSHFSRLSQILRRTGDGSANQIVASTDFAAGRSPSPTGTDTTSGQSSPAKAKRLIPIGVRTSVIGQLILHYSLFAVLVLVSKPMNLAPDIRYYTLFLYYNASIYIAQLSRIVHQIYEQSTAPMYLSLIPFAIMCVISREIHKLITALWYASFLVTYLQFGKENMSRHLVGFSICYVLVFVGSVAFMKFIYRDSCTEFFCGAALRKPIVWEQELIFITACGMLAFAFVALERFVRRNALTLIEREDYVNNLLKTNAELRRELRRINFDKETDLVAPLTRVIEILRDIRQAGETDADTNRLLDFVIKALTSNDLFAPDLAVKSGDGDVQGFLDLLMQQDKKSDDGPLRTSNAANQRSRPLSPTVPDTLPDEIRLLQADLAAQAAIAKCFESLESVDFDVFELDALSSGHPLYHVGMHTFEQHNLLNTFHIKRATLQRFLLKIESGYLACNPYHNAIHAADVTAAMNYSITRPRLKPHLPPLDVLCALVAAIIHDYQHPGYNNAFMINIGDRLALQYHDISVLEHFHCATAFAAMQSSESLNILGGLEYSEHRFARDLIVSLVLATDMANHFEFVTKFKNRMLAKNQFDYDSKADRKMLLGTAIKCADINNSTKSQELSLRWTDMIMREFFLQGDEERRRGLEISFLMNRDTTDIPKCQASFIDFLVAPLYEAWYMYMQEDIRPHMDNLVANKAYWKSLSERAVRKTASVTQGESSNMVNNHPHHSTTSPATSPPPINGSATHIKSTASLASTSASAASGHDLAEHTPHHQHAPHGRSPLALSTVHSVPVKSLSSTAMPGQQQQPEELPPSPLSAQPPAMLPPQTERAPSSEVAAVSTSGVIFTPAQHHIPGTPHSQSSVSLKECEELRFKLKVAEQRRSEDREKIRELELVQQSAQVAINTRDKLNQRLQDVTNELRDARKQLKDALEEKEWLEVKHAEAMADLELVTLDKEVAEERFETVHNELEALKEKLEELTLDLEVVKGERELLQASQAGAVREATLWQASNHAIKRLGNDVRATWDAVADDDVSEPYTRGEAPWVLRSKELKTKQAVNAEMDRKIEALNERVVSLLRDVKARDQALQEAQVKAELMESRMDSSRRETHVHERLEADIAMLKQREDECHQEIERLNKIIDQLESDNKKLGASRANVDQVKLSDSSDGLAAVASPGTALRYVRAENARLKSSTLLSGLQLAPAELDHLTQAASITAMSAAEASSKREKTAALARETRSLSKDIKLLSASARVVDLSATGGEPSAKWQAMRHRPDHQHQDQRRVMAALRAQSARLQSQLWPLNRQTSSPVTASRERRMSVSSTLSYMTTVVGKGIMERNTRIGTVRIPKGRSTPDTVCGSAALSCSLRSIAELERVHAIFGS
ncbi:3',5'-cyclic-nucleotide phosphodiesterase [Sorochytrium milnesiophthora]